MSLPLVTVVVHTSNHERHVEAALESVYEQDHEAVELVVVDDGSRDRTVSLVRSYLSQARVQSRFRRAVVIEQETRVGVAAALNRGISESAGHYINVLLGDERFGRGRLSALLTACTERSAQVAFARVEPSAEGRAPSPAEIEHLYSAQDGIAFFPTVGYALLRSSCAMSAGNLFFTRAIFDRVGGFASLPSRYDWDFALRCVLVAEPLFVPQSLYYCRVLRDPGDDDKIAVADETDRVLRNYLFLCRTRPVENAVAPSPAWGPFFESFVHASRYTRYLTTP